MSRGTRALLLAVPLYVFLGCAAGCYASYNRRALRAIERAGYSSPLLVNAGTDISITCPGAAGGVEQWAAIGRRAGQDVRLVVCCDPWVWGRCEVRDRR